LRTLAQQGDAEGFANELHLDAQQTRDWFARGFPPDGYGALVIDALGALVLARIVEPAGGGEATRKVEARREATPESETGTPLWVKVFATIFVAVVLLFLFLMFSRGPHRGPGQHGLHGPERHTPAGSHR
jgi:O-antigen/teichoic acid export membrane protein